MPIGAAELPAVCAALDAAFVARSARGERTIAAEDFYKGFMTTALAADELLVEVRIPAAAGTLRTAFVEVARRHGDFALVGVAAAIAQDGDGVITDARLVFTGVGTGSPCAPARPRRACAGAPGGGGRSPRQPTSCPRSSSLAADGHAIERLSTPRRRRARRDERWRRRRRDDRAHRHRQRRAALGRRRRTSDARRLSAPPARADRHASRLRARRVRLVHRARGRCVGTVVSDARGAGERGGDHDDRGARRRRRAERPAAGHARQPRASSAASARRGSC